jgi:hypothetical protein
MPTMRKQTFRRVNSRRKPTTSDADKIRMIRTLYMMVYNDEASLLPVSVELFHVIGDILEGLPPDQISLHRISKETFLKELTDN